MKRVSGWQVIGSNRVKFGTSKYPLINPSTYERINRRIQKTYQLSSTYKKKEKKQSNDPSNPKKIKIKRKKDDLFELLQSMDPPIKKR